MFEFYFSSVVEDDDKYFPSPQVITLGQEDVIGVEIHGFPTPNVTWKKNDQAIESNRFKKLENGSLAISDVMFSDSGNYTVWIVHERIQQPTKKVIQVLVIGKFYLLSFQDGPVLVFVHCCLHSLPRFYFLNVHFIFLLVSQPLPLPFLLRRHISSFVFIISLF